MLPLCVSKGAPIFRKNNGLARRPLKLGVWLMALRLDATVMFYIIEH